MVRCGVRRAKLLLAGISALVFLTAAGTAAAAENVNYNGGPVAHAMTGLIVDWGPNINPMYTNETSGDPGLVKYLAAQSGSTTDIGGVLAQYMDSSGHNAANTDSYAGQYEITPSTTANPVMDSQIRTELVSQIQAGNLPRPSGNGLSTLYLVLFPSSESECISSTECSANAPNPSTQLFCAYHDSTSLSDGTHVLYAVIPDNTTGHQSQWCGQAGSVFSDQTSYLTHEWAETISDPLGTAWWNSTSGSASYGNEIGDNCNQQMTAEGGWTVQLEWSNLDHNCVGGEPAYTAPTASFLAPDVAQPGQQVSVDASSSTDPSADATAISGTSYSIVSGLARYAWNWGDGTSSSGTTPQASHTYATTGTYEVSLTVTDRLGFTSTVTKPVAITSDGTLSPVAMTGSTSNVSDTAATLLGTVNAENKTVQYEFEYGTSPSALSQSTPPVPGPAGASAVPVSATLSGLAPSTTYYYELSVVAGAAVYPGAIGRFTTATPAQPQTTTAPPAPTPPVYTRPGVTTGAPQTVTSTAATVSGTVAPDGLATTYHVEFGTTAAYGHSTAPLRAPGAGAVTTTLSGLRPHTRYHYRLVATSAGGTSVGADRTFRTRGAAGHAPGFSFAAPARIARRAALHGHLRIRFHCSRGCTAHFAVSVATAHTSRFAPVAVTLAGGSARTGSRGAGSVTLRFLPGVAARLAGSRPVRLIVVGYAVAGGSTRSAPRTRRLTLS